MSEFAALLAQGLALHQAGRFDEADALYQRILQADPAQTTALVPDAWHLSGLIALQMGRAPEALDRVQRALALRGDDPAMLTNLGSILNTLERHDEALHAFEQALRLRPDEPKTWFNYGNTLVALQQPEQAEQAFRRACQLRPAYAEALTNLGVLLKSQDRLVEAIDCYRAAVQAQPEFPNAHFNLGNALRMLSERCAAQQSAEAPQHALAAVEQFHAAIQLRPDYHEAHTNLGALFRSAGQLDEAIASYRAAIAAQPRFVEAYSNLALALQEQGQVDEALIILQQALSLKPDFAEVDSNRLFDLNYLPTAESATLLHEHRAWAARHTANIVRAPRRAPRLDDSRRRRIGFVSPDFSRHPVGTFIAPLFEHLDRSRYELFAFADVEAPDAHTERLRSLSDHWHDARGESHESLARRIAAAEIDLLIDLAGHTSLNRLLAFARRPAPVQATYLGYPNTTGLDEIDYLITDAIVDPPGSESAFSERLMRLDPCFCCYVPANDLPPVSALPALTRSQVTFGSLHTLAKLNTRVLDLWAELLRRVPQSRLLLFRNTLTGSAQRRFLSEFERRGIEPERVECRGGGLTRGGHFALYAEIDIALDPFPWSGHTTACEALAMGVPVVTLLGERHASRMVASVLSALEANEWIATDAEHYLTIAAQLASDRGVLAQTRTSLRSRLQASPLADAARFARTFERAIEAMLSP